MDIQARKYNLIEKVFHLAEPELIQLEEFLTSNQLLKDSLNKSMTQKESGEYKSHSEIRKKYEKWL
jgi:hypothetical protein